MHGMIGPSCAIGDVKGDKATIWSGPQGPFRTRGTIAKLLNIPEQNVRIIYHEASGSYGRGHSMPTALPLSAHRSAQLAAALRALCAALARPSEPLVAE